MKRYLTGLLTILVLCVIGMNNDAEAALLQSDGVSVTDLKVEYFNNPIGIDDSNPRLSWKIERGQKNTLQTAYRIEVSRDSQFSQSNLVWDSGKTDSDRSVHVRYQGSVLESGKRYYWRVMVWDNHGNRSGWSQTAFWEMGLLNPSDWQAEWIEPGLDQDTTRPQPSPMLRKEFELDGEVISARAYVTAHGLYEMKINGRKVGDQVFTPGWTSYHNRLQYQTYDITELLQSGGNAVGAILGDGWYRGYLAWGDQRNHYGTRLALLAKIEVTYADGRTETIGTDATWRASTGPIRMSDIYDGETYDARMEKKEWTAPGYDDGNWLPVRVADHSKKILVAPEGPPVRKIQELKPVEILTTPEGDTVVDMGQNMVGWMRLRVNGNRGTEVTLRHAEVLDKEGNFYTANLRAADQKIAYILKGEGEEIYEPHFTFQGFRYVKVEGWPGNLTLDDLTGVVIHSDMEPTGHFETSNPLVNQLQHNIVWGQKGNFLDIPTDCPQRDERLGWTGDIQVFAQTACYNMNAAGFLTKWLRDLKADQRDDGSVPFVVPNVLGQGAAGASGWADASVIVPWTLYQAYGDVQILETQYESMKGWVEYMRRRAAMDSTTFLWDNNFTFGDWLSFNNDSPDYPGAYTDKALISTAFFARSTDLLQRSAAILGKDEDARDYSDLLQNIRDAFQQEYLTSRGRVMSNTQTSYLLALQFDLLPENMESEAVRYLVSRVNERGHLTTGFLGTPHLNPILTQYGYAGQAYELLLRREYPSWLYPVTMGATTIWERWDGIKPDSTFQTPDMNSYNHYAYGAIGEWLYKTVAGIEPLVPGYKKIAINPRPGGNFTHTRGMINSMYGKIESSWHYEGDRFILTVEIPANTNAIITLPDAGKDEILESGQPLSRADGIVSFEREEEKVNVEAGSGRYTFSWPVDGQISSDSDTENETSFDGMSKIGELLADRQAREILHKQIPGLMNSPWLSQMMGFPLQSAATALPGEIQISPEKVNMIVRDLKAMSGR